MGTAGLEASSNFYRSVLWSRWAVLRICLRPALDFGASNGSFNLARTASSSTSAWCRVSPRFTLISRSLSSQLGKFDFLDIAAPQLHKGLLVPARSFWLCQLVFSLHLNRCELFSSRVEACFGLFWPVCWAVSTLLGARETSFAAQMPFPAGRTSVIFRSTFWQACLRNH